MIRSQGFYLTCEECKRAESLLRKTDMTIADIALRMRCSPSSRIVQSKTQDSGLWWIPQPMDHSGLHCASVKLNSMGR